MKFGSTVFAMVAILAIASAIVFSSAASSPPSVGAAAPDFTLNSQEGKSVSLHDFKGKCAELDFYPKDFTTGCTIEAHNFQHDLGQYQQKNAVLDGVSVQDED